MTEPRRWLDDTGELSSLERRVLQGAERIAVPRGSKQQIWLSLAGRLPLSGIPTLQHAGGQAAPSALADGAGQSGALGSAASGAKALLTGAILKALAVGFALGGATVGAATWLAPSKSTTHGAPALVAAAPQKAAVAVVSQPMPLRLEPSVQPAPSNEVRPHRAPRLEVEEPTAPNAEPEPEREREYVEPEAARAAFPVPVQAAAPTSAPSSARDRARVESQRVAEARGLLRSGDPRGALALLGSVASEFPNGVLVQEREALTIDALLACGEREQARKHAAAFVQRYPDSPHTLAAQRALR